MEGQRAEIERRVRQAVVANQPAPVIRATGPFRVQRGTAVSVRLTFDDFNVEPKEETILWDGDIGNVSFRVAVPTNIGAGPKLGVVTVRWEGGVQVARVELQIPVVAGSVAGPPTTRPLRHIRHAFASYASADRDEVLGRIQGMQKIPARPRSVPRCCKAAIRRGLGGEAL